MGNNRFTITALVVSGGIALSACLNSDTGSRETLGMLAGGALGGLLGSQIGDGRGQLVATGAGVLIGGLIGKELGRRLDEASELKRQASTLKALETSRPQTWRNPDAGTSGTVRVAGQTVQTGTAQIAARPHLPPIPPLELIGQPYAVNTGSGGPVNVRSGPSTSYGTVGSLPTGSLIHVVGKVQGSDWYLISRDRRIADGYVAAWLLSPQTETLALSTGPIETAAGTTVQNVPARRKCVTTVQDIVLPSGEIMRNQKVTACQTPTGWGET